MNLKAAAFLFLCGLQARTVAFSARRTQQLRQSSSHCSFAHKNDILPSCMSTVVGTLPYTDENETPHAPTHSKKQRKHPTRLPVTSDSTRQKYIPIFNDLSNQKTRDAAQKAEDTLFSLELDERESSSNQLNVVHYASVINSWANIGDYQRARDILQRMIDHSKQTHDIFPNSHCFGGVMKACINAFGKRKNEFSAEESVSGMCQALLVEMNQLYHETSNDAFKANTVVYNTLLNAYAEEVTSLFLKRKMNDRNKLYPNVLQRNAHVKQNESQLYGKELVSKAMDILDEMEKSDGSVVPKPDVYTYCTVISLLAKCEDLESAAKAESYLPYIEKKYDTPTYNAVLSAWASTSTIEGAKRANALLEQLEQTIEDVDDDHASDVASNFGPNAVSYFTVIGAWVKTSRVGDGGRAAEMAEGVLGRMEAKLISSPFKGEERLRRFQPNVIAYSSIIDCWSKSGSRDAADHAKRLLERMKDTNVEPNVYTYTSAVTAFARSNTREGALEASNVLEGMKSHYNQTGDENVKPSVITYFAVIDAWARSDAKNAGSRCEELLNEMEVLYRSGDYNMKPDVRVYARVIAAHTRLTEKGSDHKANALVKRMERFGLTGDEKFALSKPNVVCYNTLIGSFARKGDPIQAFRVLNKMDQYNSKINEDKDKIIADQHSFNSIIYALSRSNLKEKAKKAFKILERLENSLIDGDWRYGEASTKSYNLVIATCSHSFKASEKERAQALLIAINVYGRLRSSVKVEADRYTYISLLKTIGKLLSTTSLKRKKLVETVFKDCCNEGLVDDSILSNFLIAAPKDLTHALLGEELLKCPKAGNLPKEWTHRVSKIISLR